ncbi:hypothetical protein KEM60_02093 [Austwickia sp. TVS 96-490-7B]|uniref:lipopolysaccharide biosynthesis protein n=1 Tax=Austwickia sp. TVS 96-490-7B TaxID=2830843 RepID=UPI001C564B8C|nr:oligosaccharide flippase family protein [Austwickia sp. TVS 96-490-7B]MBW3085882.1 hypothetical protein [Austwickia sp. TVS 96-490-7B]
MDKGDQVAAENDSAAPGRRARLMALTRLGQGGAGRHVAQLGGGTAVVMVIQFAAQVVLGAWYSPADYGVFGNLVSFATVAAMIATLRLEMAIPLAGDEAEADDIARFSIRVASLVSLVLVPVCVVMAVRADLVPADYQVSVLIAPFVVWASACFAVLRSYQSRRQQFRQMSDANVAGTLATAGMQLGMGKAGLVSAGLGVGYGVGRLLSTTMMITRSGLDLRGRVAPGLVRRWSQFPTWILFPAVVNALTVGAVAPLVTALYGQEFAGHFSFTQRMLSAPIALLGQAVASVFYVRFAAMHRDDKDTSGHMVRLATVLLGLGLVIFVPITLLCREVFILIWADNKWEVAGHISAFLAPWLMMNFTSNPLAGYATVKNAVKRLCLLSCLEGGVRVPALALGLWVGGPMAGVQAYSFAGLVICLYWTIWVMRLSGATRATAWRIVAMPLVVIMAAWAFAQVGRGLTGETTYVVLALVFSAVAAGIGGRMTLRALRS